MRAILASIVLAFLARRHAVVFRWAAVEAGPYVSWLVRWLTLVVPINGRSRAMHTAPGTVPGLWAQLRSSRPFPPTGRTPRRTWSGHSSGLPTFLSLRYVSPRGTTGDRRWPSPSRFRTEVCGDHLDDGEVSGRRMARPMPPRLSRAEAASHARGHRAGLHSAPPSQDGPRASVFPEPPTPHPGCYRSRALLGGQMGSAGPIRGEFHWPRSERQQPGCETPTFRALGRSPISSHA